MPCGPDRLAMVDTACFKRPLSMERDWGKCDSNGRFRRVGTKLSLVSAAIVLDDPHLPFSNLRRPDPFPGARRKIMRRFVDRYAKDRCVADRHCLRTPLRVCIRKSTVPEHTPESENLSEHGMFFATNLSLRVGTVVEVLFEDAGGDHGPASHGVALHRARSARRAAGFSSRQARRGRAV